MNVFSIKNFILLVLTFIAFTVIGTLSHEYGHISVAKYYGYETTLHYGSMNYEKPWKADFDSIQAIYRRHKIDSDNHLPHSETERSDSLMQVVNVQRVQSRSLRIAESISLGGPIQTFVTSILGILLILYRRRSIFKNGLKTLDWIFVFLSLFSLRFVSNMTLSILNGIFFGKPSYFGGDELKLAHYFQLPEGSLAIPLFLYGVVVLIWIVFKVIPLRHRLTFITAGLTGGTLGYLFWFNWIGPIILP